MRSSFVWDFAFCFWRSMCSANSLIAPFPPWLWHVYFAAVTANTGASHGTALKPARFRTLMSGLSLPERGGKNTSEINHNCVYSHCHLDKDAKMLNSFTHVCHVLPMQLPLLHHRIQIIPRFFSHLHHLAVHPLGQLVCQWLDDWVLFGGQQYHLAGTHIQNHDNVAGWGMTQQTKVGSGVYSSYTKVKVNWTCTSVQKHQGKNHNPTFNSRGWEIYPEYPPFYKVIGKFLNSNLHVLVLQHADAHGVPGVNGDHFLTRRGNKDLTFC